MVKMSGRAFVLIFSFWALLTIITPTLIFLSASAKSGLDHTGEQNGRISWPRRMMGYEHREQMRIELQTQAAAPEPSHISSGDRIRVAQLKSEHREQMRIELQTPAAAPEPSHISSGDRIRVAHLKSEHLNRVSHGIKREGESDVGEARM